MLDSQKVLMLGLYRLTVCRGSIMGLPEPVDALVSSDDNHLTHGGGVSQSIWRAAGPELHAFVAMNRVPLDLGELFITPAGKLRAKNIVHAITIDLDANRGAGLRDVQDLYANILTTAQQWEWESIALPLLATDAKRLSALEVVRSFCIALKEQVSTKPLDIFLCITDSPYEDCLREIDGYLKPSPEDTWITQMEALLESFSASSSAADGPGESPGLPQVQEGPEARQIKTSSSKPDAQVFVQILQNALGEWLKYSLSEGQPSRGRILALQPDLGGAPKALNRHFTLGEIWQLLQQGHPMLPPDLRSAVVDAIRARNTLVHHEANPRALRDLALSVATMLDYLRKVGGDLDFTAIMATLLQDKPTPVLPDQVEMVSDQSVAGLPREREQSAPTEAPVPEPATSGPLPAANCPPTAGPHQEKAFLAPNATPAPPPTVPERLLAATSTVARHPEVGPSIVRGTPHYSTQAVLDLRSFLQKNMDAEDRKDTIQDCRDRGFQGEDDDVLLEYCVQHKDLMELLSELVPAPRLRKKIKELGLTPGSGASGRELAEQFLNFTGFPRQRPATGLNHLRESLRRARHEIPDSSPELIRAKVNACACDLEWCLKLLVRFIVHWALKSRTMDQYLVDQGWMDQGSRVEGLTLGQLFALLKRMESKVRREPEYQALCIDLGEEPILPSSTFRISELRNMFAHDKLEDWEKMLPAREVYPRGKEFLDKTLELVDYLALAKHRVFPFVVKIESITIDNWGRRIIRGTSDGEPDKLLETLFTESELRPGEHYLMRPLSNPWRVEPVMVAIGDAADRIGGQ